MKEKLKNKKVVYTIIGIVSVLLVAVAITYAYWLVTKTQQGENVISSACLDIDLVGANDITLSNQFPMSDEEGMKLTPYEFTVTNKCNTSVDYQIALEAIGEDSTSINPESLKVALDDDIGLLSSRKEISATINNAYTSHVLKIGTLSASSNTSEEDTVTYNLRVWIDKDASIEEMNKTFKSKISVTVGQGIEKSFKEGTIAYDILTKNGGIEQIETISSEWTEGTYGEEKSLSLNKNCYDYSNIDENGNAAEYECEYYWGTEMTFNSATGRYKLDGDVFSATLTECRNGVTTDGKSINCLYTLNNYNENADYTSKVGYKVTSLEGSNYRIKVQQPNPATNAFTKALTDSDSGLYKTKDDLGDSYYFRGNVTNNYVKFGEAKETKTYEYYQGCMLEWEEGATEPTLTCSDELYSSSDECYAAGKDDCVFVKSEQKEETKPIYWRIIRINGDGTIRLAYDGTEKVANGISHSITIGESKYNVSGSEIKYYGYTYDDGTGKQVDSTIKSFVDDWYETNLKEKYEQYIADSIFCNDKSTGYKRHYDQYFQTTDDENSYGYEVYIGAGDRLNRNAAPTLTCLNKNDRYTKDDTKNGNGLLKNPIALITADEVMFAGVGANNNSYLTSPYTTNYPSNFYTMSPDYYFEEDGGGNAFNWVVYEQLVGATSGHLSSTEGVRPVINLKADLAFEGNGSFETPYEIVME